MSSGKILDRWIGKKHGIYSREELERWQLERLAQTLRMARENSSFYRSHLQGIPIPRTIKEVEQLPLLDEKELKQCGLSMVCVSQGDIERVVTLKTSGTTGTAKRLYFTAADQELTVDFFHHGMSMLTNPGEKVAVFLPYQTPGCVGDLLMKGLKRLGVQGIGYGQIEDLEDAASFLQQEAVTSFVGVPIQAAALSCCVRAKKIPLVLKTVLLSTDYLTDSMRKQIEHGLNCEVFEHFGMTETGLGGAIECEYHEGMHIRENDLLLEVIDPVTGRPLPSGEKGELVLTTLTRTGMPLIRYRTGDLAYLYEETCRCGSILKRLKMAGGRITDNLAEEARNAFAIPALDEVLFACFPEGLLDYEAVYETGKKWLTVHLIFYKREGTDLPLLWCCREAEKRLELLLKERDQAGRIRKIQVTAEAAQNVRFPYGGKRYIRRKEGG